MPALKNNLKIKGKTYQLNHVLGEVVDAGKTTSTRVSGGGGGANSRIHSSTEVQDDLFLVDKDGAEHSFQFSDLNLAARIGNQFCVVWAVKKKGVIDGYVFAHNHSTRHTYYNHVWINRITQSNIWFLVFPILGYFFGVWLFDQGYLENNSAASDWAERPMDGVMFSVLSFPACFVFVALKAKMHRRKFFNSSELASVMEEIGAG